jgi:hypothetical protein
MNGRQFVAITLAIAFSPQIAAAQRAHASAPRQTGGFQMQGGSTATRQAPQSGSHSSTGPNGTNRSTTVNSTANGYNRTTTATNGAYNRTSSGGQNFNTGNAYHSTSASGPNASRSGSTTGNVNSGNYSHSGSGQGPYGSYNTSGSGNAYNRTYNGSTTATNAWGQTYHASTSASNGYVYRGAVVTNPVYYRGPAWGWNGGVVWYPAPTYYGGGFWGAFALGAASAAAYGSVTANNATVSSYEVQQSSPGAKLLQSYQLTQTPCGPPNLVVIYGPNDSVICAKPNQLVSAGNYSVNPQTLAITSEKPA